MDRYAVVGNPIEHSKSPLIHKMFAEQFQHEMTYEAIKVEKEPADALNTFIRAFFAEQGKGVNVTVPFKEVAWELADIKSPAAMRAGAVNTLSYNTALQKILGDNTDGVGLVKDLVDNQKVELSGQRILVLGAGGAVRGVLNPLLSKEPSELVIVNRTLSKAQNLVALFSEHHQLQACDFSELEGSFDVIINGTSASLSGNMLPVPESAISSGTVTYDMMYAKQATLFNQWSASLGAKQCIDGLGMLVEQAAEAFYIWRGVRPDTAQVVAAVREMM